MDSCLERQLTAESEAQRDKDAATIKALKNTKEEVLQGDSPFILHNM
jgi:hypothetical protein